MRVFEPGELLSQVVARPSLDALYGLVYPELGIHLQKHVGVIRHDLHLDDLEGELGRDLAGYLPEAHVHSVHQHACTWGRRPRDICSCRRRYCCSCIPCGHYATCR